VSEIRYVVNVYLFVCSGVTMGNCYRMPRRSGARKDAAAVYRPSSTFNKSDAPSYLGPHNAYIGSVSRRAVSSSTSLQHISEREPDGQLLAITSSFYWPTVLSVEPMVHCVVCLSLSVVVCNVLYCGKTVRPSEKVSEGVNRKPGSKSLFLGSPPYFYFRLRRYGHQDGRFCLIFARIAQQSVPDGRN